MRIILVRHGESEGNVDKNIYTTKPDYSLELTEKGKEQALTVGGKLFGIFDDGLPFFGDVVFYVSPFVRTMETYKEIKKSFVGLFHECYESPLIIEQQIGNVRSESEMKKSFEFGRFYYKFPNGESGADVYYRCHSFIESIKAKHESNDIIYVVTHAYTMRVLKCILTNGSVSGIEKYKKPENCEIMTFSI